MYGDCRVTGHFSENIFFSRNFYRDKHVMHVHAYATLHKIHTDTCNHTRGNPMKYVRVNSYTMNMHRTWHVFA